MYVSNVHKYFFVKKCFAIEVFKTYHATNLPRRRREAKSHYIKGVPYRNQRGFYARCFTKTLLATGSSVSLKGTLRGNSILYTAGLGNALMVRIISSFICS